MCVYHFSLFLLLSAKRKRSLVFNGMVVRRVFVHAAGLSEPPGCTEAWDYVEVRPGAHMFWWLYYAESQAAQYKDLPLVMWLQGGPGGSGTGFGNFEEIGPLNRDLQPRKTSWVQTASLLFVDNPVGTGFSYAERPDGFATDVATVASDMLVLLRHFFTLKSDFQSIPFYIFSESYGGKMAAAISLELTKVTLSLELWLLTETCVSFSDSVMTWGPYLYTTSLLDDYGLADVNNAAQQVKQAVAKQDFLKATELWSVTESVVEQNTNGVNFYNILKQEEDGKLALLARRHIYPLHSQSLSELMNGSVRKKLAIIPQNVTWGGQAEEVFSKMAGDFMKPVVDVVDQLLTAGVNVTVYNGQLDLIVDTMGQEMWVKQLKWEGIPSFNKLRWTPLDDPVSPGITGAFYKTYKNFAFYWILKAGHMIPSDQGPMALQMLKMIVHQD
uniref:Carboxypeptidase n=1 Tax=Nothobranchius furzeri TaxID=105023 RepID=A0A8C6L5E6_NOTFU